MIVLVPNLHPGDSLLECILFYRFQTFLHGTVNQGYRLFIKFGTYFQGTARVGCSLFIRFLNVATSRELSAWMEPFLYGFQTYLQGTVGRECSLFYLFQTYIQGAVCWGLILFLQFQNHPLGDCQLAVLTVYKVKKLLQGSKSGVQSVYKVSEPT